MARQYSNFTTNPFFGRTLIAKNETFHDKRSRIYQTVTTGVDPSDGSEDPNPLTDNTYLCKGQAGSCFGLRGYGFCLPLGLAG